MGKDRQQYADLIGRQPGDELERARLGTVGKVRGDGIGDPILQSRLDQRHP
jgi:hypothetical protein